MLTDKQFREKQRKNATKHGMKNIPEYRIWCGIKKRCYNIKDRAYKNYGARGIVVCDEWKNSFEQFYKDMGPRPFAKYSIDRIDNNKGYGPNNCRWASVKEQNQNTRSNINVTFQGKTQCMAAWADELGIRRQTLFSRIEAGWSVESAFTLKPVGNTSNKNRIGVDYLARECEAFDRGVLAERARIIAALPFPKDFHHMYATVGGYYELIRDRISGEQK